MTQDSPSNLNTSTVDEHTTKEKCLAVHPVGGYNVSVESGVVMDLDPHMRKISDGSSNLSQGSHSYIGTSRTMTCSCSECKLHRERSHSISANSNES